MLNKQSIHVSRDARGLRVAWTVLLKESEMETEEYAESDSSDYLLTHAQHVGVIVVGMCVVVLLVSVS